jgi:hypothetical protein
MQACQITDKNEKRELLIYMARKERIGGGRTDSSIAVNLDFRVGHGGENCQPDVMLVQSLLRYIGLERGSARRYLGNIEIPNTDGICGPKTRRAIEQFQRKHSHRLMGVDGVIYPAKYNGQDTWDPTKPTMTITLLHSFAWDAALSQRDMNYIEGLMRITPRLRAFLTHISNDSASGVKGWTPPVGMEEMKDILN